MMMLRSLLSEEPSVCRLSVCRLSVCLSVRLSSVRLSSVRLSVCPSVVCPSVRLSSVRLSSVTVGRHTQRVEVLSNILQHIIAWGLGQLVLKFWALNVKILSLLNSTINLQQHHFGMLRSRSLTVSRIRSY